MGKKIVIALGGNALGKNLREQMAAVKETSKAIADLIEDGNDVVISHGNGPQVGMIQLAMDSYNKAVEEGQKEPLSVCVAMSQGYIGYDLQNSLREELLRRGINKPVCSFISQVVVDANDPAFDNPTKPVGDFMTKEEADKCIAAGENVIEDSGRGYRRVVASPKPISIIEEPTVKALIEAGQVVVAAGGGGIPVIRDGEYALKGAPAVIDKDFASAKLAENIDADMLIILTAVEKVAINFGKDDEEWLSSLTPDQAARYAQEGHFGAGSMEPKVEAAAQFAASGPDKVAIITLLSKAREALVGKTGTIIKQ